MKRKQFLALMLTVAVLAGTNTTAVTSLAAERAASLAWGSPRSGAALDLRGTEGPETAPGAAAEDESDALEKAIADTVGKISTGASKEETVYVFTDAYGTQRDITVSNWLKNPEGKDKLEDYSDLQDIENVKGDETFDKNSDGIVWNAGGNDLYYQ